MRRSIVRTVAGAAMAIGLAAAPVATPLAHADHGEPGPGWNMIHIYPTERKCDAAGHAGSWWVDPVNGEWDEHRCDPVSTDNGTEWELWVVIYVV